VGWRIVPARSEIDVDVYQVFIGGEKPSRLMGADDTSIAVRENSSPSGMK
jgi:hypothetical protein